MASWYSKYAVITLSAAAGLGAYEGINWSNLSPSDWGTWVGAVGTVATLFGTIHLATTETRRRNKHEYDVAVITAAFMNLQVSGYVEDLRNVIDELKKSVEDGVLVPYENLAWKLHDCPTWTRSELEPLTYVGHDVAVNLAIAQELVRESVTKLGTAGSREHTRRLGSFEIRAIPLKLSEKAELNKELTKTLEAALERVTSAFEKIGQLLERARVY